MGRIASSAAGRRAHCVGHSSPEPVS